MLVSTIALTLTFFALVWYAWETKRLRITISEQLRISVMPFVQVRMYRNPDRIHVENVGPGIASKVLLQGFRYTYNGGRWKCTFEPATLLPPRQFAHLGMSIASETSSQHFEDPSKALMYALQYAIQEYGIIRLEVYTQDILGNSYKAYTSIGGPHFFEFVGPKPAGDYLTQTAQFAQTKRIPEGLQPIG